MEVATEGGCTKSKKAAATPPPPPPPLPKFTWVKTTASVTNQEIAKFWSRKRMEEEEHFLAAIKAAACSRAKKLAKDEYEQFMESLEEDEDMEANVPGNVRPGKTEESNTELRVGIKDWWTKSKYAYLNQPTIEATKRPTSTYVPYYFHYTPPTPPQTIAFGIF